MKHKKTALLLALCLLFALAGCSKDAGQTAVPAASGEETSGQKSGEYDFPDVRFFDATLLDGSAVTAEDLFDGKDLTVINCWATWCPPCLDEMDELAEFEKALPDNVQLLLFCVDAPTHTEECQAILDEAGFEGRCIISATGDLATLVNDVQYIPTTIFVNNTGKQLCDSLVGAQQALDAAYKERINIGLKAAGKSEL